MARLPGYLVATMPRCRRLPLPDDVGDGPAEWCETHDALWPPLDRSCRTVRAASRAGYAIVSVRVRWWHPGAWLAFLRFVVGARTRG